MSPKSRGRPKGLGKPANLWELTQAVKGMKVKRESRHYPIKPKGIIQGPSAKTSVSLPRYAELFAQRDGDGKPLNLSQIGDLMGVTRERVRQIRKRYFPELGGIRVVRKVYIRQRRATSRFNSPSLFRRMVRQWLAESGYFQCCHCFMVKCLKDRTKTREGGMRSTRCKSCTAESTWRWWLTAHGRAKVQAWTKANPDKVREYTRRSKEKKCRLAKENRENANHNN